MSFEARQNRQNGIMIDCFDKQRSAELAARVRLTERLYGDSMGCQWIKVFIQQFILNTGTICNADILVGFGLFPTGKISDTFYKRPQSSTAASLGLRFDDSKTNWRQERKT